MAQSKGRVVLIALTVLIIYFLFIASPTARSEKEYRQRTEDGLSRRHSKLQGDISDKDWTRQTNEKLQAILNNQPYGSRVKSGADSKAAYDAMADDIEGEEESDEEEDTKRVAETVIPGRHRNVHSPQQKGGHADHARPRYPKAGGDDSDKKKSADDTSKGGKDVAREQLQTYLKNPIVIFSKSYCPHSKQAKHLLTKVYTITPAPVIVELDQLTQSLTIPAAAAAAEDGEEAETTITTLGAQIQSLLGDLTRRSTVPNIVLGGAESIGGNDLVQDMHKRGTLIAEIQKLVGKRGVTVVLNPDEDDSS